MFSASISPLNGKAENVEKNCETGISGIKGCTKGCGEKHKKALRESDAFLAELSYF